MPVLAARSPRRPSVEAMKAMALASPIDFPSGIAPMPHAYSLIAGACITEATFSSASKRV